MSTSDTPNGGLETRRTRLSAAKRELLERRLRGLAADAPEAQGVTRRAESNHPVALSFAQERLWFLDRLEPGTAAYNIPLAVRLTGRLDTEVLRRCFAEIVRRHEVLRTRIIVRDTSSRAIQP